MRLARHGFQVVGVDFAEVVLDAARENIRAAGLQESVELQRGDLTRLSFPTGSFRRVLCWGVLMHVPDLDAAVAELSRVLAPGGLLAVNDANLASLDNLAIAVRDRLRRSAPRRRRTRVGVERWKTTAAGPLLIRQSDMNRLVSAFESHGLRLRARFAGELTETYAITGDERLRRAIHRVNDVWFRRARVAGLAQSNVIVLERPETAS